MAGMIDQFARTPANFRALRDMVGVKQDEFADIVGVDRSDIRRMDGGKAPISDSAWAALRALLDEHSQWVADLMGGTRKTEPGGTPVRLVYYRSFEDYHGSYGTWVEANIVARESAARLMALGYNVEFFYPGQR